MEKEIDDLLSNIDMEIDEIDLYGYDIIETSLSMVHRLQTVLNDLRTKIQSYVFSTKEDEILFFKTQNRKFLVGYCFSTRFIGLKHNVLMEAMMLSEVISIVNWITSLTFSIGI